jgi:hypothetical protein
MNKKPDVLGWITIILMMTAYSGRSQGAIIWDGPTITFTQPAGAGTSVADQLTPDVSITRDLTQGIFNAVTEASYTHNLSPQDTAWAYGSLGDYASLGYTDWEDWNGHRPPSMVGQPAVVHLISENIYLSLTFTSWGQGGGGGFSYVRSTPNSVPEPSTLVLSGLSCLIAMLAICRKASRLSSFGGNHWPNVKQCIPHEADDPISLFHACWPLHEGYTA